MNATANIITGVIYRIPNTNTMDFTTSLVRVPEQLRIKNKMVYLTDDYDIGLPNSETYDLKKAFPHAMC